jgi:O-antigen/teichoic acid export membrane protein
VSGPSARNLRVAQALPRLPRWTVAVADQGLVAVINLALSILVTHLAGVSALGGFTIVTTTILVAVAGTRILISDPWLASRKAGQVPTPQQRWLILLAATAATVMVAVAVLIALHGEVAWWWACAIAPLVILQDFGRYMAFRREQPGRALASDLTILVVGAASFGVCAWVNRADLSAVLISWAVGLAAATCVALSSRFGKVSSSGSREWWHTTCRPLAMKLAHDGLAFQVGVNGSLYLLAAVGTHQDVGIVRVVQSAFSPLLLTITGLNMWLVPFLAHRDTRRMLDVRRKATGLLALTSIAGVAVAVWAGPWLIGLVFGAEAVPDRLSLLLAGGWAASAAVAAPWLASVRVAGTYAPIAWTRTAGAAITWVALALIPWARGVNGYLALLALQYALVAVAAFVVGSRITLPTARKTPSGTLAD